MKSKEEKEISKRLKQKKESEQKKDESGKRRKLE